MKEFNLDDFAFVHMDSKGILRERREILGLTQKQVAERARIPFQSYQRIEVGNRKLENASFQMACRILEALELDISAYYHGDYVIGERLMQSKEGLRYKKTGTLVGETVEED